MSLSWNFVNQRIAVGGEVQSPDSAAELARNGITHVINCQETPDVYGDWKFTVLHIGTPDDGSVKPSHWFGAGIEFALKALQEPMSRVYIHCRGGNQRGPSMCYAVLRALGFPPAEAYGMLLRRRPSMLQYDLVVRYRHDADRAVRELGYEGVSEHYLS